METDLFKTDLFIIVPKDKFIKIHHLNKSNHYGKREYFVDTNIIAEYFSVDIWVVKDSVKFLTGN